MRRVMLFAMWALFTSGAVLATWSVLWAAASFVEMEFIDYSVVLMTEAGRFLLMVLVIVWGVILWSLQTPK